MRALAACEQKESGALLGCPADCHPNIPTHTACSHGRNSSVFPKEDPASQGAVSAEPLAPSLPWGDSSVLQGQADTDNGIPFVRAPLLMQGCCTWQVFPVSSSHQGAAFSLSQCLGKLLEKGLQGPFIFHTPTSVTLCLTSHLGIAHSAVHVSCLFQCLSETRG